MAASQVALITGGASGMGLAVVENLVSREWKVAILDKDRTASEQVARRHGEAVMVFDVDVANYEQQADAFARTWREWGRLDLVYANAGVADRTDLIEPAAELDNGAPARPDMLVVDVNLYGVIFTSYLALHFFRKNSSKKGNLVMTSSLAGIYAAPGVTAYCATKHGVVGLTRSLAKRLKQRGDTIRVNTVCPAFVPTGLVNPELIKKVPKEYVTPTSTIVRAINRFLEDESLTGQVVETTGEELIFHRLPEPTNESSRWVMSGGLKTLLAPGEEQAVRK